MFKASRQPLVGSFGGACCLALTAVCLSAEHWFVPGSEIIADVQSVSGTSSSQPVSGGDKHIAAVLQIVWARHCAVDKCCVHHGCLYCHHLSQHLCVLEGSKAVWLAAFTANFMRCVSPCCFCRIIVYLLAALPCWPQTELQLTICTEKM